jgi:endonuclease/exonuclease/phosphatase family metal-dependent hydrolase
MNAILSSILGAALLGAASLSAAAEIDVMTQNQYLGADLAPVLGAATAVPFDPVAVNAAVVDALCKIAATRPAERALALAAEIGQRKPDVVGLQEAFTFECTPSPGFPPLPGMGCDDPAIKGAFTDHLQNTEEALRGKYVVAGQVTNLKVDALPFVVNGYPALLAIADRDAILVRAGLPASWVNFASVGACLKPSAQGCNYQTAPPPLVTPLGTIAIERGFIAVDVTIKGRVYRVFTTHLEQRLLAPTLPDTRLLQVGQAYELVGTVLGTWDGLKTVIVVGDMNSDPTDTIPVPPYPATLPGAPTLQVLPPYAIFTLNGFTDAWTLRPHDAAGLTCCQAEDLANRRTDLYERIDMIFTLPRPSQVLNMKVLGNKRGDKTRPPGNGGLWPSDHAALAAKLKFN